jgi:hypothetical protein
MSSDASIYADRTTGQVFDSPTALVNAYLTRFGERTAKPLPALDMTGYAQFRWGSATVGVNVLAEEDMLLVIAPIAKLPAVPSPALLLQLLELSFLATAEAAFAVDAAKQEICVRALRSLGGLDYTEFEELVATVARVADEWDDVLRKACG